MLSGQVTLKGSIVNLPASVQQIAVDYWSGESWAELDRIDIAADKSFNKTVKGKFGQARLRLWGEPTHWIDFILPKISSGNTVLDFGAIDYHYFDGNPANLKGKEQQAYFSLLTEHKKYRVLRDSFSRADKLPAELKSSLEKQVEEAKILSNKRCTETMTDHMGSFTGDIVAKLLYVPVSADYAANNNTKAMSKSDFEREYLLNNLPLADSNVLLHNGLIRALNQYTSKFLDADSSVYVKRVLGKMKGNPAVNNWMFKYLFQVSLNYKNDNAISYLVQWYYNKSLHAPIEVDRSTENLLIAFRNCEVDKKAFNLVLPDATGKPVKLADIASKSRLTLLLFWRTDCSHCHEFEPELELLYQRFKPLGLEVIAISVDMDEGNWRNYLAKNPMKWTSLFPSTRELKIQTIANFPIPGTPAIIALDSEFKVKNRMVIRNTIEQYLVNELGE